MADLATQTTPPTTVRRGPITVEQLRRQPTVSVEQAAQLIGVSRGYGYQLVESGELPAIKLGPRRVRVISAALLKMLCAAD